MNRSREGTLQPEEVEILGASLADAAGQLGLRTSSPACRELAKVGLRLFFEGVVERSELTRVLVLQHFWDLDLNLRAREPTISGRTGDRMIEM